jgi:peptidoglycan-N-acetylglucosamine deacetylase
MTSAQRTGRSGSARIVAKITEGESVVRHFWGVMMICSLVCLSLPRNAAAAEMAITIDDLPIHGPMPKGITRVEIAERFLAALQRFRLHGVYGFPSGEKLEAYGGSDEILKAWIRGGQILGNHTYSHLSINETAVEPYEQDILRNEPIIDQLMGRKNYHAFRYPYLLEGDTPAKRKAVADFLSEKNYRVAQVTVNFHDWIFNEAYARCLDKVSWKQVKSLKEEYLSRAAQALQYSEMAAQSLFGKPIKHILLLHLSAMSAEMLPQLLAQFEKSGVRFIPLAEAMDDPAYKNNPSQLNPSFADPVKDHSFLDQHYIARGLSLPSTRVDVAGEKINALCLP